MAKNVVETARTIMDLGGAPWEDLTEMFRTMGGRGTFQKKTLTAPDGHRVGLVHINGAALPHFHTKASTLYVLDGSIELRNRGAGAGSWVLEPYGAIHPNTRFNDVTYGLGMSDGDFGVGNVSLKSLDEIPEWVTKLGFKIDEWAHLVDAPSLAWQSFGPGLTMKVLHVFDGRPAFAALIKAEPGGTLPRRRYLGPADMYVISGRAEFRGATAGPGHWVHQPIGAEDDPVTFPVATELLANTYGTILELDEAGALTRAIDGYGIRALLGATSPQPAYQGSSSASTATATVIP